MEKRLKFFSIGSGSSGNCYYVGTDEYGILIDAGVGVRALRKALKDYGVSIEQIWGVFITHDHTDHVKSVGVLGERYMRPVYLTAEMQNGINRNFRVSCKINNCCRFFKKGETVVVRDFKITSFPVSHDATDCVGYTIEYENRRFVFATDLGYIGREAAEHILRANYLVLEANYDNEMLKNGPYPYFLKQRVSSHTGHLSNEHTARFLADNAPSSLSHLFLCHLSQENNTPELAESTVRSALEAKGVRLELIHPLERHIPSQLYIL